jgi:hypothetical protein
MYKIKQFFRRIYNLYRWAPIIWKDQDWDDHYIFEILKFKLKNQAEYIGGKNRHTTAKRDAEIMMLCVRLIDKVQNEYYGTEYFNYHKSDMRFIPSESHPGSYEMEMEILEENFDDYFKKYPLIYRLVPDLKASREKIAFQIAKINEERAHKLLFTILQQNIRRWWD